MKKLFTVAMMILGLHTKAQVVLEHSYSTNSQMEVVNIEGEGYKYLGVDTATKAIKIYNTDHSLWKSINTSIPQNAAVYGLSSFASKYFFNGDNKIEALVIYTVSTPTYSMTAQLYNEDGIILNTFNNTAWYNIADVNGSWKLLVRHNNTSPQHTEVYTIPGQWTGTTVLGKPTIPNNIFPRLKFKPQTPEGA